MMNRSQMFGFSIKPASCFPLQEEVKSGSSQRPIPQIAPFREDKTWVLKHNFLPFILDSQTECKKKCKMHIYDLYSHSANSSIQISQMPLQCLYTLLVYIYIYYYIDLNSFVWFYHAIVGHSLNTDHQKQPQILGIDKSCCDFTFSSL